MRLVIVLPLRNQTALDNFLKELYNPASPSYRQFLTVEEFTEMFGPTQQDYDAVVQLGGNQRLHGGWHFPQSHERGRDGVGGHHRERLPCEHGSLPAPHRKPHLLCSGPRAHGGPAVPAVAHRRSGQLFDSASLPSNARKLWRRQSEATTGSCPDQSFCGSDMRAAYYGGTALTGSGQSLGLLEYVGTDLADLDTYYTNAGQTLTVPITLLSTDGTSTSCTYPSCDDTEQTIDMTQALGMAPGLSSLVMYVGSTDSAIFNAMATASPLNAQLSSSWTWYPADPSTDNPYFQEFAAQGQNLFQAAGDGGAVDVRLPRFGPPDNVVSDVGRRDGLRDHRRGRPSGVRKLPGLTAAAAFRRTNSRFPSGRRRQPAAAPSCSNELSQRPGRFGQCEFHLLRLRRSNHLHG